MQDIIRDFKSYTSRKLKEVLNTVEDEKITLTSFGNDKSALVKSSDPNQTLVLMPLLL